MDELERARAKVVAGEVLTDGELQTLERAAAVDAGPTLRLAVAHALSNADRDREALELFERLARDFPNDVQARLGHARALFALERYADAEAALHAALKLNPGDPEAFKALAVCALRRGERARALDLVLQVLRADPFDGEARLIKEEVDAGEMPANPVAIQPVPGEGPSTSLVVNVTDLVRTELQRRRVRGLVTAREVVVLVKGELRRAPLPLPSASFTPQQFVGDLLELPALDPGAQPLLQSVLPVLRPADFASTAKGAMHRDGPAGLLVFYVLEHPELVRYVPAAAATAAGLTLEALDRAAFTRLEATATAPKQVSTVGLWILATEDGHDAARLLTASQRERMRATLGPGPWRVWLGRREAVFACREAALQGVHELDHLPGEEDGIEGRFRLHEGGLLERVASSPSLS